MCYCSQITGKIVPVMKQSTSKHAKVRKKLFSHLFVYLFGKLVQFLLEVYLYKAFEMHKAFKTPTN